MIITPYLDSTKLTPVVPAPVRGLVVGTYQFSIILGGLIINSICKRTSEIQNDRAWRIPLGLYYIVPSIILCSIWFIPESPRWLLHRGRTDEAKRSLYLLRDGCFSGEQIEAEFHELKAVLESETESGTWADLVQGVDLKRTALVVMVNFFQQATGQAFASQYGTVYIKQLGTVNPFAMSVVLAVINLASMSVTLAWTDRVGRR